jgi:hypothetical protein
MIVGQTISYHCARDTGHVPIYSFTISRYNSNVPVTTTRSCFVYDTNSEAIRIVRTTSQIEDGRTRYVSDMDLRRCKDHTNLDVRHGLLASQPFVQPGILYSASGWSTRVSPSNLDRVSSARIDG